MIILDFSDTILKSAASIDYSLIDQGDVIGINNRTYQKQASMSINALSVLHRTCKLYSMSGSATV